MTTTLQETTKQELERNITVLQNMKELLSPPGAWIKGISHGFRDSAGVITRSFNSPTNCWCLSGAIDEVLNRMKYYQAGMLVSVLERLAMERGFSSFVVFNDYSDTQLQDIQSLLDEAIAIHERRIIQVDTIDGKVREINIHLEKNSRGITIVVRYPLLSDYLYDQFPSTHVVYHLDEDGPMEYYEITAEDEVRDDVAETIATIIEDFYQRIST